MLHDLKHACRMLLQSKGWTTVVLLSLAIGIGATTALFTAVNGLLLQTIPVPNPGDLVVLKWSGKNNMVRSSSDYGFSRPHKGENVRSTFSNNVYQQLKSANQTMTDVIAGTSLESFNFASGGSSEIASAFGVSGNYFKVLGVSAAVGRTIEESDAQPGAELVAVISHGFWQRRFSGDTTMRAGKGSVPHFQLAIGMTGDGARRRSYDTGPGLRELLRRQSSLLEGENGGLTPVTNAITLFVA